MQGYKNPKSRNESMNAGKEKPNKVGVGFASSKKTTTAAATGKSKMKSPVGFQGGTLPHEV